MKSRSSLLAGTGSPGWSRKKGRETVVVWCSDSGVSSRLHISILRYLVSLPVARFQNVAVVFVMGSVQLSTALLRK